MLTDSYSLTKIDLDTAESGPPNSKEVQNRTDSTDLISLSHIPFFLGSDNPKRKHVEKRNGNTLKNEIDSTFSMIFIIAGCQHVGSRPMTRARS